MSLKKPDRLTPESMATEPVFRCRSVPGRTKTSEGTTPVAIAPGAPPEPGASSEMLFVEAALKEPPPAS